jgi:hypothetical protein
LHDVMNNGNVFLYGNSTRNNEDKQHLNLF